MTPTARSLALLRRSGYLAAVVEKWIPRINRRRDTAKPRSTKRNEGDYGHDDFRV